MSESKKGSERKKGPAWLHYAIDYAGLAAFLLALLITRDAVAASWAVVVASLIALAAGYIFERRLAPIPLLGAVLGLVFGGLTVIFHDDRFIKVKPTILYTVFGLALLTGVLRGKNPLKAFFGEAFHLPDDVARTLAFRYALFFFAMAIANEVVWRTQSTITWGLFKFPGAPLLIFAFVATQLPLLMKHAEPKPPSEEA